MANLFLGTEATKNIASISHALVTIEWFCSALYDIAGYSEKKCKTIVRRASS